MRDFAESVGPERFSNDLQDAIHGAGAFGHFKSTLRRYRREQDWYDFKDAALRRIAIGWCEENGIEYTSARRRRIPSEI
jgi:isopentenyl phosphate kinase